MHKLFEFLLMFCPFWFFLYHFVGELHFYRKQKWDFKKQDTRWRPRFHYGEGATAGNKSVVSNHERIRIVYPLCLVVSGAFMLLYCLRFSSGLS